MWWTREFLVLEHINELDNKGGIPNQKWLARKLESSPTIYQGLASFICCHVQTSRNLTNHSCFHSRQVCNQKDFRVFLRCLGRHGSWTNNQHIPKISSGIIGNLRKKNYIAKWEILLHEMLAVTNLHWKLSSEFQNSYEQDGNRSYAASTRSDEKEI